MAKKKTSPSIGLIIFAVVAAVLVVVCAVLGVNLADSTFVAETAPQNPITEYINVVDSTDEKVDEYYTEIRKMQDLQDLITSWSANNNDAKFRSSAVTTFLLTVKEAAPMDTNYGNADLVALVSVNTQAKTVSVVTLDSDMFVYLDLKEAGLQNKTPIYTKLKVAYANGGIALLEQTVENNFKIEIDHYLVTDMDGVKAIVEALGGLKLTASEELTAMLSEDFETEIPAADAVWNAQQVVSFLRETRDGTISRNARHNEALNEVITGVQKLGMGDAFSLVKTLSDVCKTDLTGAQLFHVLRMTLLGGWKDYSVSAEVMPEEKNTVSYKDAEDLLIVDIPMEAQALQKKLFNNSNITLNENRLSATKLVEAVNSIFEEDQLKQELLDALENPATDLDENGNPVVSDNEEPVSEEATAPVSNSNTLG